MFIETECFACPILPGGMLEKTWGKEENRHGKPHRWNLLGDGEHTVVALVDGGELGWATVSVTTLGAEFLQGVAGECGLEDFPMLGQTVTLEWQQSSQNFVITRSDE